MLLRRSFLHSLLALMASLLFGLNAYAAEAKNIVRVLDPPRPTENPGKIEVVEFFSYGCPHCAEFAPVLDKWAAKQQKDVVLRRVPGSFGRPAWVNMARLFHALEANGQLEKLDHEIFEAIHKERVNLFDPETLKRWVGKRGLDEAKFGDLLNSFAVQNKVKMSDMTAVANRIDGVPIIVVNGVYVIASDAGFDAMLEMVDKKIAEIRASNRPAPKSTKK